MPIRIGEYTTVSTSNFYFYPPLGTSSIAQGYLLATGPTGFMVPQNPNILASTIVGGGYLDSTISTTISSTNAALSQTSTLTTYVSINTASISSLNNQVCTISTNLQNLSNFVLFNIGATPGLSTQVSSLTAGYSTLVYEFSSLSTVVNSQGVTLSNVSTGLQLTTSNLSSLTQNVSSLSTTVSSLVTGQTSLTQNVSSLSTTVSSLATGQSSLTYNLSSLSSYVRSEAQKLQLVSDSLSTNISNVSTLSSFVISQSTELDQVGTSLCTTIETVSSLSSVVAGFAAGTVTVGQFTALSTYTSSLGGSVGTLYLNVGSMELNLSSLTLNVSTLSSQVSSLQSTTDYLLNNSLTNVGVLGLLSSQNNVWFGSNIQVSSVSSNIYFDAGCVGVGTSSLVSSFNVGGTSLFSDIAHFSSAVNIGSNLSVRRGLSSLLTVNTSAYAVSIGGVAGPGNRLVVAGNTSLQGALIVNQDSYLYSTVNIYNGDFAVNTNTFFVNSGTGRVGIGCNAPAYTLDVAGSANISSDLIVNTSTLFVSSGIGRVGVGCNVPSYTLDVAGSANISRDLIVNTSTLFVSSGTGRVGVGCNVPAYTLDVDGSANISSDLIVNTSTLFVSSGTGRIGVGCNVPSYTLDVAGSANINRDLIVNTSTLFVSSGTGRVGVGCNAPAYTLDVAGSANINRDLIVNTSTLFISSGTGRIGVGCNVPVTTLDVNGSLHVASTVTFDQRLTVSSLLYVNSNVGIGCNAPIYDLDVHGSTHTYKLDVDYNNVFQSTPLQSINNDVIYINSGIYTGLLVPATILNRQTNVFQQYSLVLANVTFYNYAFPLAGAPGSDVWYTFKFIPSPSITNSSNEFVCGPFGTNTGFNTSYSCVLRRGVDYLSTDTALSTTIVTLSRTTPDPDPNSIFIGLLYFSLTGIY